MAFTIVFDDSGEAPAHLKSLVGVERFGDLVFQRSSQLETLRQQAQMVGAPLISVRNPVERARLLTRVRDEGQSGRYLYCPSHLTPTCGASALDTFLRQIDYSPTGLHMPLNRTHESAGWTLTSGEQFAQLLSALEDDDPGRFFARFDEVLPRVYDRLCLIDLRDERALLDFLSGQFDARHFNAIEYGDYTLTKRSIEREKLRREFDFYAHASPEMQSFLVQPFDFKDDGTTASYRMERLAVPDMALQWILHAFAPHEFDRFLRHFFYFISVRPSRAASGIETEEVRHELYVDKVHSRIKQLKLASEYAKLVPLFERSFGGIDALVERYMTLYSASSHRRGQAALVLGHGDPCFSNILYSKSNQYLKLIDARGSTNAEHLFTDPYYDVAKLSHSVLGGYDFINQYRFNIRVGDELRPALHLDGPPPEWAQRIFAERLAAAGFNLHLTRLYEASLFISMLPLHMDWPLKVLGFAINASNILEQIADKAGLKDD